MQEAELERLEAIVRKTDANVLVALRDAIDDPGGIYAPEAFTALGLNEEVVKAFDKTHLADPEIPGAGIQNPDGKQIEQLRGVYGVTLLAFICNALGIRYNGPQHHQIRGDIRIRWWNFYRSKLADHLGIKET